jgi:predicted RNA binding protein YcfA (HicA-like mRNA interferase family)
MKVRDVLKITNEHGWFLVRTRGSHRQFHHEFKPGTVTVAGKPSVDIPKGTLKSIFRQAQIEEEDE